MSKTISLADKPTLHGTSVLLRPVDAADVAATLEPDPEGDRFTGSHPHGLAVAQREDWYATRADHADRLDLAVIDRAPG